MSNLNAEQKSPLITVGSLIVRTLQSCGATTWFGLIGSSTLEIYEALRLASDIRYIGCRDERSAAIMCETYARRSRELSVVLAGQSGPGVTNLVTGLALAEAARTPIVALGGAVSRAHRYRISWQEVDQVELMRSVAKATFALQSEETVQDVLEDAALTAQTVPRGPVYVDVPRDLTQSRVEAKERNTRERLLNAISSASRAVDCEGVRRIARLISVVERPAILVGSGVETARASADVCSLAEICNAPIMTSYGHRDAVPNSHQLFCGQLGPRGSWLSQQVMEQSDLLLVLGSRLGFGTTYFSSDYVPSHLAIAHTDRDPQALGRFFPAIEMAVGDAGTIARMLSDEISKTPGGRPRERWSSWFQEKREKWLDERAKTNVHVVEEEGLSPYDVASSLRKVMPSGSCIVFDAGSSPNIVCELLDFEKPGTMYNSQDFACVGFGLPGALGVKAAAPEETVIAICGDGGFGMSLGELATAIRESLPVIVCVLNNGAWGSELAYQEKAYGGNYFGAYLTNPSFAAIATAYGADGYDVSTRYALEEALVKAIKSRSTTVIDIKINQEWCRAFREDVGGCR